MDQQTKNRRIHAILNPLDCLEDMGAVGGDWICGRCGAFANEHISAFDYFGDIRLAREALAFAVEQGFGEQLATQLKIRLNMISEAPHLDLIVAAALAPPSVLCDAVIAVLENDKEK